MKVYLWARFDCKIETEQQTLSMRANDIYFFESNNARFFVSPTSCEELLSYSFELNNGELFSSFLTSKKVGSNLIIELKPLIYYSPKNLEIQNIKYNSSNLQIHLYDQAFSLCKIFYNNTHTKTFCNNVKLSHFTKTIAGIEILFIKLIVGSRQYYYIFNKKNLLFEGYIKEINIKEKTLILLIDDINCYGEKRVKTFNLETNEQEQYLIHYDNRNIYLNLDINYLFLDAIMVQDFNKAKAYLSSDLRFLDSDILAQFFGDFDSYQLIENCCFLQKNDELTSIIQLAIKDNLIYNIINLQ